MSRRWRWILGIIVAVVVIGILNVPDNEDEPTAEPPVGQADLNVTASPACMSAFAEAASVSDMQDTVSDLYPALRTCESLEDWTIASDAHPEALDGTDPETFARNACRSGPPEVQNATLCQSLQEG